MSLTPKPSLGARCPFIMQPRGQPNYNIDPLPEESAFVVSYRDSIPPPRFTTTMSACRARGRGRAGSRGRGSGTTKAGNGVDAISRGRNGRGRRTARRGRGNGTDAIDVVGAPNKGRGSRRRRRTGNTGRGGGELQQ